MYLLVQSVMLNYSNPELTSDDHHFLGLLLMLVLLH